MKRPECREGGGGGGAMFVMCELSSLTTSPVDNAS